MAVMRATTLIESISNFLPYTEESVRVCFASRSLLWNEEGLLIHSTFVCRRPVIISSSVGCGDLASCITKARLM